MESLGENVLFWRSPGWSNSRFSVSALVVSNCIPLIGVLLFGWRVLDVVYLYWLENVIIGGFNLLKIACCVPPEEGEGEYPTMPFLSVADREKVKADLQGFGGHAIKLFLMPFFTVHYGMFCFVHGVFIVVLLSPDGMDAGFQPLSPFLEMVSRPWFAIAVLGLIASHGISFVTNYIGKGEYKKYPAIALMFLPYGRIVILHIAIIFGAFLILSLGSPVWMLVIVVLGKIWMDIVLHLVEHGRSQQTHATAAQ